MMMMMLWIGSIGFCNGQQGGYGDGSDPYYDQEYEQDNLYYNYASRQQGKAGYVG